MGVNNEPGYLEASFYMQHVGIQHTAVCVMGYAVGGAAPGQSQFDAMLAGWALALGPLYDSEVSFPRAVYIHNRAGTLERWESVGSATGLASTRIIEPPNVTYLLRKPTGLVGRRFRGRVYLPFAWSDGIDQTGTLTGSNFTALQTAAAAIKTNTVAAPTGMANLALLHSADPPSSAPAPTIISSLAASNRVATQRRRLVR